jgi:rubredoxin
MPALPSVFHKAAVHAASLNFNCEVEMDKYRCTVCGYIYDPEIGDTPKIKPGTAFENLPDDWVCPQCGVGKEMFEKI